MLLRSPQAYRLFAESSKISMTYITKKAFRYSSPFLSFYISRFSIPKAPFRPLVYSVRFSSFLPEHSPHFRQKALRKPKLLAIQFHRDCSNHRGMLQEGLERTGGSLDVTKGRVILPTAVKPTHYELTLEPNFEKFNYAGTVVIDLEVNEDTTSISLNSQEIDIHSTTISSRGVEVSSSPKLAFNENDQTTTISFDKLLRAGTTAQLTQTFTGYLNEKMAGFYRSSYKDKEGKTKYIASTQMEPADCRRAFPCFDEPALKSQFSVTLIADKDQTCLSNMSISSEKEVGSGKKAVTFQKSPPMSTYLVAFVVGELNYIETKEFRIPIRVYATPDKDIEQGRFSLNLAAKTLAFYEKEFASLFPLPKMDMVAVPDFNSGAMENWGLITYRVVDVLFDEKTSGASTKQRVAEVVQHELAHQWFGNLVTMDFWDGLWLNEGFATWMSWYSCNKFFPEWRVWENFVTDDLQVCSFKFIFIPFPPSKWAIRDISGLENILHYRYANMS